MLDLRDAVEQIIEDFESLGAQIAIEFNDNEKDGILFALDRSEAQLDAQRISNRISELMKEIMRRLEALRGSIDEVGAESRRGAVRAEIEELQSLLGRLTALASRLDSLVQMTSGRMLQAKPQHSGAWQRVKNAVTTIMNWIKSISSQLWQLLCRLMTPKEWKLSGKIGTGVLGLADVGVEVSFG